MAATTTATKTGRRGGKQGRFGLRDLNIRNAPKELVRRLKHEAIERGMTMRAVVLEKLAEKTNE